MYNSQVLLRAIIGTLVIKVLSSMRLFLRYCKESLTSERAPSREYCHTSIPQRYGLIDVDSKATRVLTVRTAAVPYAYL